MEALPQRITAVARSVDGLGLGLYSLISAVLPEASSGAGAWKDAINRNDRLAEKDRQTIPTTYMGKVEGNRKQTHVVLFEHAPSVLKFVLKEPMDFFGNTEAREAFAQLVGREFTDLVANALVTAEAEHTEACMCLLPALVAATDHVVTSMTRFRTTQLSDGQLLGSIYDFVTWLGLDEHVWRNWLADAFKTEIGRLVLNSAASDHFHGHPILENIAASGTTRPTPMTNYAGFCLILRLCAGRSTISDAMIDEATIMLGRVKVGDSRLHAEIEHNAAAASAEDRAFVLGEVCDSVPNNSGGHSYDNSGISESSSLPNLLAVSRGIKRRKTSTTGIQKWGESVISIQGTLKLWGVHHAVLKAYTSDVANAMLAIKSKQRNGEFFDVRLWGPLYKAHKYIPSDEPLLREAVDKTRELLKKRILDLRRDLAHNARIADTIGKK